MCRHTFIPPLSSRRIINSSSKKKTTKVNEYHHLLPNRHIPQPARSLLFHIQSLLTILAPSTYASYTPDPCLFSSTTCSYLANTTSCASQSKYTWFFQNSTNVVASCVLQSVADLKVNVVNWNCTLINIIS